MKIAPFDKAGADNGARVKRLRAPDVITDSTLQSEPLKVLLGEIEAGERELARVRCPIKPASSVVPVFSPHACNSIV